MSVRTITRGFSSGSTSTCCAYRGAPQHNTIRKGGKKGKAPGILNLWSIIPELVEEKQGVFAINLAQDPVGEAEAVETPVVREEDVVVEVLVLRLQDAKGRAVHPDTVAHVGPVEEAVLVAFVELAGGAWNHGGLGKPGGDVGVEVRIGVEQAPEAFEVERQVGEVAGDERRLRVV